ncbi:DNA alkylation repair protein [Candidatus Woesearchaeota archaeon]|nr:DNA alkylation repair protein [Candidatus Woesearchaeota archaeon]
MTEQPFAVNVTKDLHRLKDNIRAESCSRYFKTGKGDYGEGDKFLGLTMGQQRQIAKKYTALTLPEIQKLLAAKEHESRMTGLFILINKYDKTQFDERKRIYEFYLKNTRSINNWDLVDCTAHRIVGKFIRNHDPLEHLTLYRLAKSKSMWERRISIISCFEFIRNNDFEHALKIAEILLNDDHDLIHKAVGWMLREIGKRDIKVEEEFLKKNYQQMPRTMLRYAIEHFSEKKRQFYMKKE